MWSSLLHPKRNHSAYPVSLSFPPFFFFFLAALSSSFSPLQPHLDSPPSNIMASNIDRARSRSDQMQKRWRHQITCLSRYFSESVCIIELDTAQPAHSQANGGGVAKVTGAKGQTWGSISTLHTGGWLGTPTLGLIGLSFSLTGWVITGPLFRAISCLAPFYMYGFLEPRPLQLHNSPSSTFRVVIATYIYMNLWVQVSFAWESSE